jgi:NAD(P)-dependent dehydrogenase (short-subunit alcohol dehydrogenase family)
MTPAIANRSTIVVGASRGLGRGIATAFAAAGALVVSVSRSATKLENATQELADATDQAVAARLIERYAPEIIVVVAGESPHIAPLQDQTWETFSLNWHADVQIAFNWLRAALAKPLAPGSLVVVISSGAAVAGSPLSGGYAGAKATQRFIAAYAQEEATRAGLGITFTAVLPRITPLTDLGRPAVEAYAARAGISVDDYLAQSGEPLSPESVGATLVELAQRDPATLSLAYLLSSQGLKELP